MPNKAQVEKRVDALEACTCYSSVTDPALSKTIANGSVWIEINDPTDRKIVSVRLRESGAWTVLGIAGSGGGNITIQYAILVQQEDVIT